MARREQGSTRVVWVFLLGAVALAGGLVYFKKLTPGRLFAASSPSSDAQRVLEPLPITERPPAPGSVVPRAVIVPGEQAPQVKQTPTKAPVAKLSGTVVRARLVKIVEKRRRIEEKKSKDDPFEMFDRPALELGYRVELPVGMHLAAIKEPATVNATDDTGNPLPALPEVFGNRNHLESVLLDGDNAGSFTFKLGLPIRSARSLNLSAALGATLFSTTATVTLAQNGQWTDLDPKLFGAKARYRTRETPGGLNVDFQPEQAFDRIAQTEHIEGTQRTASNGWMRGMGQASASFPAGLSTSGAIEITVRMGVQPARVVIEEKNLALP